MNVLLIGNGAREHAIAAALKQATIYNIANRINPGILALAKEIAIMPFENKAGICAFAKEKSIHFAIIGPEKPLELGLAEVLWQANIPVIGPTTALAQIECSKGFARDLMRSYRIPGLPHYQRFPHVTAQTEPFLKSLQDRYVVKADGLMSGKGVKVAGDHLHSLEEALDFCESINGAFVIEEKLLGHEFSLLSFSDGNTMAHMPVVQDHKRLLAGDQGPNTGGMGTITFANHRLPFLNEQDILFAQKINESIVAGLHDKTGQSYQGILYGGFMKTTSGIKVIEYNARFGDPEAINLLGLLKTDFLTICQAIIQGKLHELPVHFENRASVCKYLVPNGYPNLISKDGVLDVSAVHHPETLYYGAIEMRDNKLVMQDSRALAVFSLGEDLSKAEASVEKVISEIQGDFYYRADIGKRHSQLLESPWLDHGVY